MCNLYIYFLKRPPKTTKHNVRLVAVVDAGDSLNSNWARVATVQSQGQSQPVWACPGLNVSLTNPMLLNKSLLGTLLCLVYLGLTSNKGHWKNRDLPMGGIFVNHLPKSNGFIGFMCQ